MDANQWNFDFEVFLRVWVWIALGLLFVEAYLTINKIWIRKHEPVVAESISVSAQLLALASGVPFVALYIQQGAYEGAVGDSLFLLVNLLMITIGIGFWVEGRRPAGFWRNVAKSLRLERAEATTLIHDLFRPQSARRVLGLLYALAMLDEHLDEREIAFIRDFAARWDIDMDSVAAGYSENLGSASTLTAIRDAMRDYLATTPPREQANHLRDVLTSLASIDEHLSEEEELVLEELGGMIDEYTGGTRSASYHVFIAPQSDAQEVTLSETMPNLTKERRLGGEVFKVGRYHSHGYAQRVCSWYREAGYLTITERDGGAAEESAPAG